jgi:hypothetical protein
MTSAEFRLVRTKDTTARRQEMAIPGVQAPHSGSKNLDPSTLSGVLQAAARRARELETKKLSVFSTLCVGPGSIESVLPSRRNRQLARFWGVGLQGGSCNGIPPC